MTPSTKPTPKKEQPPKTAKTPKAPKKPRQPAKGGMANAIVQDPKPLSEIAEELASVAPPVKLIPKEGFAIPPDPEKHRQDARAGGMMEGRVPAFLDNPEIRTTIMAAIGMGLDLQTASQAAGVMPRTFQAWLYRGRDFRIAHALAKREGWWERYVLNRSEEELAREEAYIGLLQEVETTHARFGLRNVRTIQDAAEGIQRDLDGKIVRGKTQDANGKLLPTLRKKPSWQAAAYLLERRRSKLFGKPFFDASPNPSSPPLPNGHIDPQAIVNAVAEVLEERFAPVVTHELFAQAVQQIQDKLTALSQQAATKASAPVSQFDSEITELAEVPPSDDKPAMAEGA